MKEMPAPCASEPVFDAPGTYHDIELSLSGLAQHPLSGFKHILVDGGARILGTNVLFEVQYFQRNCNRSSVFLPDVFLCPTHTT